MTDSFIRSIPQIPERSAGIYIHIPFCKQACNYCNFHFSTSLKYKDELITALKKELVLRRHELEDYQIRTIYFGGGTPSLLHPDTIASVIDTISSNYKVDAPEEITLEANPDDLDKAYIKALRRTPVNRLSIGVQSFKDADLQYMNRAHSAQEAIYSIKAAQDADITNISIDLIYGTPGLTDNEWRKHLQSVKELSIPHFSAYALTVEERTALHHKIKTKKSRPVDAAQSAHQFEILSDYCITNGYEHYEISNIALPGYYARHNTSYWLGVPYIGAGPAAHSYTGTNRKWNIANNALYIKSLLADNTVTYEEEILSRDNRVNEYVMTSLRTKWGCSLDHITNNYGEDICQYIVSKTEEFIDKKQLIIENNTLYLTAYGRLFADHIAAELFL